MRKQSGTSRVQLVSAALEFAPFQKRTRPRAGAALHPRNLVHTSSHTTPAVLCAPPSTRPAHTHTQQKLPPQEE
eukprot:scaffold18040_cov107-Isochrysis_galbana.AAC.2